MVAAKRFFEEKYQRSIPLFVAGGILTEEDVTNALKLGADGVQVASPVCDHEECDASMAFKKAYLQAEKEDTVVIKSPVGMPGGPSAILLWSGCRQGRKPYPAATNA